jgi:aspartate-semialdehyde dehydrogenase
MHKDVPLIVPEVNLVDLKNFKKKKIIANPNCSTIQLVIAISEIHKSFKIKRMIVSTYQAVSGSGKNAIDQLRNESKSISSKKVYERQIFNNIIPQCDIFDEDLYTKEEHKIINETNKILNSKIRITATAVRVPIENSHSESVNIELVNTTTTEELIEVLKQTSGVQYMDSVNKYYSTPHEATGSDLVYVGRVRQDFSKNNCFNLWIVSDNLRKGAATNAIQILEKIINK